MQERTVIELIAIAGRRELMKLRIENTLSASLGAVIASLP